MIKINLKKKNKHNENENKMNKKRKVIQTSHKRMKMMEDKTAMVMNKINKKKKRKARINLKIIQIKMMRKIIKKIQAMMMKINLARINSK